MYFVYILKCSDNSFYTGSTDDLARRMTEHTTNHGGNYTRSKGPVVLAYHEEYDSEFEARKRELQIKGWSRKKKQALIDGDMERLGNISKIKR